MIRYPKPEILDRLPARAGVVQASAGTGKTYTLERLVVDLLLKGRKLEEILVVTFTEKATLEIGTRVRKMLETLVALEATPEGTQAPAWDLTPEAQDLLATALRSFDRAAISTIHGFCRQVLQDSAFEGGSLFRQELADGKTLFRQAFRDLLRTDFSHGPAAVLLGDMARHVGWGVEELESFLWEVHQDEGVLEPSVAGLEAHLQAFPADLVGREAEVASALEAIPHQVLHSATRNAALRRLPDLLSQMAQGPSALAFCAAWEFDGLCKATAAAPGGPAARLGAWLGSLPSPLPTEAAILAHGLLGSVRSRLAALKAEEGLYDFDDMVKRVRDALADAPSGAALAQRLGARFKAAIIDEFQDTDAAQWAIFRRVFLDQGLQLYVIGDPKQGIYGFRGGDLPTYLAARETLIGAATPVELTENHRSTPEVIAAYNHLFTHCDPAFFQGENTYEVPVACGKKDLVFQSATGERLPPVRVVRVPHEPRARVQRAVAHALAQEIRELVAAGAFLGPASEVGDPAHGGRHRIRFQDVQVLVGKRKEGLVMAEALREAGVPSAFYKQDGLFQSEEALDLLEVLRAIERPRDAGRLARALLTPFFGYAPPDLEALPGLSEDHPVRERLQAWHDLARERAFPQLLDQLLHGSGLAARLRLAHQGDRSLTNHLHLAEVLAEAARERTRDLPDLVRLLGQWVDGTALPPGENGNLQRLEAEPDAVQILTMHQSKGLEAPVVALYGFTGPGNRIKVHRFHEGGERRLWLGKASGPRKTLIDAEAAREAERLMYVALTRAKARLILPCVIFDRQTAKAITPVHPAGATRALNPVLRAVVEREEAPELFEVVDLPGDPEARPGPPPALDLSAFIPPGIPVPPAPDYEAARRGARPALTTSYTHLTGWVKHRQTATGEDLARHQDQDQPSVPLPPGEVPGGARAGQAMHALLEEMDLEAVREKDFEAWWTAPRQAWAGTVLGRFGMDRAFAEPAARRAFQAVHAPLPSAGGKASPLLDHDPDRLAREMDFLASYFDTPDFLNGAMDVVYQRGGLTYVLDWKNDLLASYAPEALEAHVRHRYAIQVKLYTWIILRWLRIEQEDEYEAGFGGLHYVFLRGLPEEGVWHHRPTWAEVTAWKADLMRLHAEVTHG